MLIWNTFCECIKICTLLVMAQCLNFWLLVCFLRSQDWLWSNFTSIALLQGEYRRHFLASVHVQLDLIHFLSVHQELHTPCRGPVFTSLTTCLLLAGTRLFWNSVLKLWIYVHVDTLFVSASRFAHLVMVQCLYFWLLLCFLQEQHWLWNNSTSTASLQGADTRHFIASVHVDLIHFLWVHWDLHTPSSKTIWRQSTDFQTNWNAKPNQQNPTSNAKCRASGNANCNATIASHLAICPCNVQVAKSLKWCWLHLEWLLL